MVASDQADELENLEIELLLTAIARRYGYDFRNYAHASLRRRVRRMMQTEEVPTISRLQDRVLHDSDALRRFVSTLSVHVTAMFRDPNFYRAFRTLVVPLLRTYPFARIWHAGCSTGEEVYSMAILLSEEGIYDRCRVYATDLSDEVIERAKRGIYPIAAMRDHTTNYLKAGGTKEFSSYYTTDAEVAVLRSDLRRNVVFSQHNLVSDGPFNEFNVILCRNVMIYFDETLRNRVHELLYNSLANFGVLVLGLKESIMYTPFADRYETLSDPLRMYRRIR